MLETIPYFSVVIPVYNLASRFHVTLDSLANQTFQDFEVVIVDDYSEDFEELRNVVMDYERRLRIKLLRHTSNKNGAAARNTGIVNSEGEFIAFLDSDDTWKPEKLETMKQLTERPEFNKTIYYTQSAIVRGSKVVAHSPLSGIQEGESAGDYLLCRLGFMQTSTIVCSRAIASLIKFDERYIRHQDWDFCIRASASGFKFHFVDKALSTYFTQPEGLHNEKIKKRGFNPKYCEFWIDEMSKYLSPHAVAGYKYYVLAPAYAYNGQMVKSVATRVLAFLRFSQVMRRRILTRIKEELGRRIGFLPLLKRQ